MSLGPVVAQGVLVAYGDYNANTGPIDVLALSPEGDVTVLLNDYDTEQTINYRALDEAVWTTSVDPLGGNPGSVATNLGGTWHSIPVTIPGLPVIEHGFDIDQEDGTLCYCGSRQVTEAEGRPPGTDASVAIVWESDDNGATWTEALAYLAGVALGNNRFYEFTRVGGLLAVNTSDGSGIYVRGLDGTWTHRAYVTPDVPPGRRVYVDSNSRLVDTDRGIVRALPGPAYKWTVTPDPSGAYWLCNTESIYLLPAPA